MVGRNKGTVVAFLLVTGMLFFLAFRDKFNLDYNSLSSLGPFSCPDIRVPETCGLIEGINIEADYPPWGLAYTPFSANKKALSTAPMERILPGTVGVNITCERHVVNVAIVTAGDKGRKSVLVSGFRMGRITHRRLAPRSATGCRRLADDALQVETAGVG